MVKLSVKQQKFADEYIATGNAYKSAVSAGYSENYAKGNVIKLLENESVKLYIDQAMTEHREKALWTRESAVYDLLWLRSKSKESIEEMGVRQANSNSLLNAIKELNTLEDLYPKKNAEPDNKESAVADALRGLADGIKSHSQAE